jgi:L-Ala-D/L-Glu epimerase
MQIVSIRASVLSIPFNAAFKHASAERSETQTLWVESRTASGHGGYGEGCPREYVTGESLESAQTFANRHCSAWMKINGLPALRNWVTAHKVEIDANPSAWAAVELSLLDALGREEGRSIEALLGLPELSGHFSYTAVLGDASAAAFKVQLERYLKTGFTKFKIKLSGELEQDIAKVTILKEAGIESRAVRADANNIWPDASAAIPYMQALAYNFMALEEPLKAGDQGGLKEIADKLGCRIILDESLLRTDQLPVFAETPQHWIVNLRISKMGGLLRSLELVNAIRTAKLGLIIGAHVGETSVLTRAALSVANSARDILLAQEGAFGTHLLSRDVVAAPLMFGRDGLLDIEQARIGEKSGMGLNVEGIP